jgi:riboflavin kinase/FMN adenylyltransferase
MTGTELAPPWRSGLDPRPLVHNQVVRGRVEAGDQRGRRLGVPTANIPLGDDRLFADGVYAGLYVRPDGATWPAAVSLGRRPTFYPTQGARLLEAHLIGFSGELTGEEAEVLLLWYLRPQRSFGSSEELAGQLRRDIDAACQLLCEGLSAPPDGSPASPSW